MQATYKDKQFIIPIEIGDTIMVGKLMVILFLSLGSLN